MIAKIIDCAPAGEAPGPFRASGGFRAHWAAVMAGGTAGARVARMRVTGCRSADPDWALREIAATQALAGRRSRGPKTYRLLVSFRPGERPEAAVLDDIEDTLVAAVGLAAHQRLSALHEGDGDGEDGGGGRLWLHVAVNKVHPRGFRTETPFYDRRRLMAACGALEAKHGLVPDHHRGGAAVSDAPEPVQAVDGPGEGEGRPARARPGGRGRPRGDDGRHGPPRDGEEPPPDRDPDP
jgi:hypothetical protein